jgi:hypothetical protein
MLENAMKKASPANTSTEKKVSLFKRIKSGKGGKNGKRLFYAWITYQCIKGALTTSLIWIPLIYAYLKHHHYIH